MIELSLQQAAAITGGHTEGNNVIFKGATIDTRTLTANNLFIALKGELVDGHDFIEKAKSLGAAAALVSRKVPVDIPQLIVKDPVDAMGKLAHYWRQQFTIPFIGITGSCGKTTTSQMTGAILNQLGKTLVPKGNKNNHLGVPLTLFNLGKEHQFAVIEMGANNAGDIRYLASIVKPNVSIITNVAPVHLSVAPGIGFGTLDGIYSEKSEIFDALANEGTAIVCADDAYYPSWKERVKQKKSISFGLQSHAYVRAINLTPNDQMQYSFDLVTLAGERHIQLSSLGRHNVVNALAASAAALAVGASLDIIKAGLAAVPTVDGRMIRHRTPEGALLIDDTYNSNVRSAKSVLDMLAEMPENKTGKTIAILGDMLELGDYADTAHREVGAYAKKVGIHHLYAFGSHSAAMADAYGNTAKHFMDVTALVQSLRQELDAQTAMVVKGSHGMHMEKIVEALI